MKIQNVRLHKGLVAAGSLLLLLSFNYEAKAALSFNVNANNYDSTIFGGQGGWSSGSISLPLNTSIGPNSNPLEIDLTLSHDLTINNDSLGYENYGFGMGGFNPLILNGQEAFTFSIQLLKDGMTLGSPFGFTETNPFDPINYPSLASGVGNLSVTSSTFSLSMTFNQIRITVNNLTQVVEVTDFSTQLGVVAVPEPTTAIAGVLLLLPFGVSMLRKKVSFR